MARCLIIIADKSLPGRLGGHLKRSFCWTLKKCPKSMVWKCWGNNRFKRDLGHLKSYPSFVMLYSLDSEKSPI